MPRGLTIHPRHNELGHSTKLQSYNRTLSHIYSKYYCYVIMYCMYANPLVASYGSCS